MAYGRTGVSGSFVANRDGSNEQPLTGLPNGVGIGTKDTLLWSPDGNWLLIIPSARATCYFIGLKDGVSHAVTLPTSHVSDQHKIERPVWSPSSRQLALFDSVNAGMVNAEAKLYLVDMAHIEAVPVLIPATSVAGTPPSTGFGISYSTPVWLDEHHVVFSKSTDQISAADNRLLILVDVTSRSQRVWHTFPLTEIQAIDRVTIAPNGRHLAFTALASKGTRSLLYILDPDGNVLKIVPDVTADAWFSWSPDGKLLGLGGYSSGIPGIKITWLQLDDFSLHQMLAGTTGLVSPLWSPDSHALLTCQHLPTTNGAATQGKTLLIPIAAEGVLVTLFDTPICPMLWLP